MYQLNKLLKQCTFSLKIINIFLIHGVVLNNLEINFN